MKRSLFRVLCCAALALFLSGTAWAQQALVLPQLTYTSADVTAVNSRVIFFAHKSVGGYIIGGLRGLQSLDGTNISIRTGNQPGTNNGITEYEMVATGSIPNKITEFENLIRSGGYNAQIAFVKFCYDDFRDISGPFIEGWFDSYVAMIDRLERDYPGIRFVHVTVPLYDVAHGWQNNLREDFNWRLRNKYGNYVFDLAAVEAFNTNGSPVYYNQSALIPAASNDWVISDGGHPNDAGSQRLARALIAFLGGVQLTGSQTNVTFTAAQTGGTSGTADSTGIVLTFNQAVTGLAANNITITNGTGAVTKGTLSGSGTTWTIGLSAVTTQGNVTVSVANFGNFNVTTSSQTVAVYKNNTPVLPTFVLSPKSFTLANSTAQSATATGNATGAITVGNLSPANANISVTSTATGVNVQYTGALPNAGAPAAITSGPHTVTVTRQGVSDTLTINVNIPAFVPTTTFGLNPTSVTLTNATAQSATATGNATGAITVGNLSPANANISVTSTATGVNVQYTGALPSAGAPAAITSGPHTVTVTRQGVSDTLTINVNIPAFVPTTTFGLSPKSFTLTNATAQTAAATGNATGAITVGNLSPANANISVTSTATGVNVQYTGALPSAGAPAAITSGPHTVTVTRQGESEALTINVAIPEYATPTYNLAVSAETGGTLAGTSSGSYAAGDPISVTATANSGYSFTSWTVTGVSITGGNSANPATFNMPAGAVALTANFTQDSPIQTAPVITSVNSMTVVSGTGGTFQVMATGTTPITYALMEPPTGVSINPASGLITIAETTAVGSHTFMITAINGTDPDYAQSFTLTIASYTPPTIISVNSTAAVNGAGGTFQVTATGTEPITYSLSGQPAGVSIDSTTGLITIAATTAVGSHTFTITAADGINPDATMNFTLVVNSATDDDIQKAYIAFFNRPADVPGLKHWRSHPGDMQDILTLFSESEEYLSDFDGLNNTEILTKVYQNLFGRLPEYEGLSYWLAQMDAGWITIANVAYEVLGGAQNEDFDIIVNKARTANMFTAALNTPEKTEAYNDAGPIGLGNRAKEWLAAVNEDDASLEEAAASLPALINELVSRWNEVSAP
ncbi:MAG: DUF4214 domain-containing protein [Betaproteobacteria bacterium]|nr:DUF4214 domain-containing protein [Betaproteobacteria bacterium]